MKRNTVSVIVPVYNSENFLQQCVDSITSQTYSNIEIILVNDGSTDASGHLCDCYAEEYPYVITVHQKNAGAAAARRNGVLHAGGEYITFVDADDWVEHDYLEQLVMAIEDHHVDAVIGAIRNDNGDFYTDSMSYFKSGRYDRDALQHEIYPQMLSATPYYTFGIYPSMCGKLWKRAIAIDNIDALCIGVTFGEDGCFTYSSLLDCDSIYITADARYGYRLNAQSVTHSYDERLFAETPVLQSFYRQLAQRKKWDIGTQLDEYIAYVCGYVVMRAMMAPNAQWRRKRAFLKRYINQYFPRAIAENIKFASASWHTRLRYVLIMNGRFSVLKGLITMKRNLLTWKNYLRI